MNKLYIVHPDDSDLKFFAKLISGLRSQFCEIVEYIKLEPNNQSHEQCLEIINYSEPSTILILCHGVENSIKGCNREGNQRSGGFNYGTLVSPTQNIGIFEKHKVFCMACHSNSLSKAFIDSGADVYVGFGDVLFSLSGRLKKRVEDTTKHIIRSALEHSITQTINSNGSFNMLVSLFRLFLSQQVNEYLHDKECRNPCANREIAKSINRLRNEIIINGDGSLPFITME